MKLTNLNYRQTEIGTGAVFGLFGLILLVESVRLGAGWGDAGPQPGFFPFVLSLIIVVSSIAAAWQGWQIRDPKSLFDMPEEVGEVLKVGLPVAVAIILMKWAGFYIACAAYFSFFAWWYGRHRWYLVVPGGIALSIGLYFAFEIGFRVFLPKSKLYGILLLF
jgi:putative tricarboxylic transport membrane protein